MDGSLVYWFFLIFAGAGALASLALYSRQPLLIAYIAIGCALGPHGIGEIGDAETIGEIGEIGIIFLLFLLGLDMQPRNLTRLLGESFVVAFASSVAFLVVGFAIAVSFGATWFEGAIVGVAATFSSTIIGIKLLPTTVLHHRHVGELVVSLLLLQDLFAILALVLIGSTVEGAAAPLDYARPLLALPVLIGLAFVAVRFIILPVVARFDVFHEFIFLVAVGWCLAVAVVAAASGLSLEIGGFIAGVALATHPIAQYMAESLRPLRDFFLVLFFFAVGASFDLALLGDVLAPAALLSLAMLLAKPALFRVLLVRAGETPATGWEVGYRLGQMSEFSLMIAYLAAEQALIGERTSHVIQGATILTFLLSSYLVVFRYPSPISPLARLRRD